MNDNLDILLTVSCFFLRNHVFSVVIQLLGYWLSGWEPVPIYPNSWFSTAGPVGLCIVHLTDEVLLLQKSVHRKTIWTNTWKTTCCEQKRWRPITS